MRRARPRGPAFQVGEGANERASELRVAAKEQTCEPRASIQGAPFQSSEEPST